MNNARLVLTLTAWLLIAPCAFGDPGQDLSQSVEVGNKICPVTGNPVDDKSMGEPAKVTFQGRVYTLCCKMCLKDFKKEPEKYSKAADNEVVQEKAVDSGT